jgi:hypothetical protein
LDFLHGDLSSPGEAGNSYHQYSPLLRIKKDVLLQVSAPIFLIMYTRVFMKFKRDILFHEYFDKPLC